MTVEDREMLPAALLAAAEHDVRGLLQTLQLGADTLGRQLEGTTLSAAATAMARATDRLTTTLAELVMTAAAMLEGEPEEEIVDLGELAVDVAGRFGVGDVRTPGSDRLLVTGNAVILGHLLANLVENAVAAGGAAHVQVRARAGSGDVARLAIRNPTRLESSPVPGDGDLLHTRSGRGLKIVRVLAGASGVAHTHDVVDGVFISRLTVPGLIRHPSAGVTTDQAAGSGAVIEMDAFRSEPVAGPVRTE